MAAGLKIGANKHDRANILKAHKLNWSVEKTSARLRIKASVVKAFYPKPPEAEEEVEEAEEA